MELCDRTRQRRTNFPFLFFAKMKNEKLLSNNISYTFLKLFLSTITLFCLNARGHFLRVKSGRIFARFSSLKEKLTHD